MIAVTPETALVIGLTFFAAGLVKGVIGLGLPTVSLALLTATLGLKDAVALLLAPSFATNLWQGVVGGHLTALLRRLWTLLAAVCIGTWFGAGILARGDVALLSGLLGLLLCAYAMLSLTRVQLPAPGAAEWIWSPVVGAVNGFLTGMTGSFVVPGVMYLQALGLGREAMIQAMGVLFTVSTLALAVSLNDQRLLSANLAALSLAAVVPAFAGMALGQLVRKRLSEAAFRMVFFASIAALGAWIAVQAAFR